jgi:hypothetical protein
MPYQPSEKEEEHFKLQELKKIKRLREQAARDTAELKKKELKELHWMRCPKCGMEMAEIDYRSVKVDTCFACGGMFLDHGEVDKLLEQEDKEGTGVLSRVAGALFGSGSD